MLVRAICTKLVQPNPWHRSTRYPVEPELSVEAVQVRLICDEPVGVATGPEGSDGGVVSLRTGKVTLVVCVKPLESVAVNRNS